VTERPPWAINDQLRKQSAFFIPACGVFAMFPHRFSSVLLRRMLNSSKTQKTAYTGS
jgi:hypothetical protein